MRTGKSPAGAGNPGNANRRLPLQVKDRKKRGGEAVFSEKDRRHAHMALRTAPFVRRARGPAGGTSRRWFPLRQAAHGWRAGSS